MSEPSWLGRAVAFVRKGVRAVFLPFYLPFRQRYVREWAEITTMVAEARGDQIKIAHDNAVILRTSAYNHSILVVMWVVCDREGVSHILKSARFDIPRDAFATYHNWIDIHLSDNGRAIWWDLPTSEDDDNV